MNRVAWGMYLTSIISLFLFAQTVAFAEDVSQIEGATLEAVFTYRECVNPEVAERPNFDESMLLYETPDESKDYVSRLLAFCRESDMQLTENGLCFRCERILAVDDLFVLQWTVENVSDDVRVLDSSWLTVNDELGGGRGTHPQGTVLQSGDRMRYTMASVVPDLEGTSCELRIDMFISNADGKELGITTLAFMEERSLTATMGLTDNETLEAPWRNGILRVTEAKQNLTTGRYTVQLIFDSEEQARANDPCGENAGWSIGLFTDSALTDDDWIAIGGGDIGDVPEKLEDGRWAYSFTRTTEFINWLPKAVYLAPCPDWGEADPACVIFLDLAA